jgi:intraflagellar transport protein 88
MFSGSRRSNSGLSSRAGSGFSPVPEHGPLKSPLNSGNRNFRSSRFMNAHNSAGSTDSGFAQPTIGTFAVVFFLPSNSSVADASYSDPLGPQPIRPRTGAGKPLDFDDFGNDELGDDLLPE